MRTKELHQGQLLCKIPMYFHHSLLVGSVQLAILAGGQSSTVLCSHDQIWCTTQSSVHCNLPLLRLLTPPKAQNFGSCHCSLDIEIDDDLVGQLPTLPPAGHPVLITVPLLLRLGNSARPRQESCTASHRSGPQSHSFFTTCALTFAKIINQRV